MSGFSGPSRAAGGLLAVLLLSGCTSPPQSIAPPDLEVVCSGEGSPTVILVPGMNTPAEDFASLQEQVATDTRVCSYSRAGIAGSPAWPEDAPDPSAGMMADQLRATLDENVIPGPYVMLGWSWGGMVTQAFADRHRDAVAGVVLEDSSLPAQFEVDDFDPSLFTEAGRDIDHATTTDELGDLTLSGLPVIVLTQGDPHDEVPDAELEWWKSVHDDLSELADDSMHLIAVDAGHAIHWDSEALVEKAIDTIVAAVRSGDPLPDCDDDVWVPYGGECRLP
jgi:pimeloyl-ACP methyl ester carboxylesterase